MADNYYLDNADLRYRLAHARLEDVVRIREEDFADAEAFPDAPESFGDAMDSYDRVLAMLGELCGESIGPRARDVDAEGCHLVDGRVEYAEGTRRNLEQLRQAQLMGVMLPRRYGGLNMPCTVYTMMNEMVSRADASLQNLFGLQDISETIHRFGSDDQKERYLPLFARGEVDGAMDLTEPEAGSDLQAVRLRAWQDPETGQWYLNGMKRFITNGCAKVALVLARSEEGSQDGRGLSMFLCRACPQLVVRRIEDKFGIHGSPTCELQFNDVPAELVGARRRGLTRYVMSLMNGARVAIAAQALGIAEQAYREMRKYGSEREQFGRTIDRFPAVYDMLVRAKTNICATRALLYETTRYVDLREEYEKRCEEADKPLAEDRDAMKRYSKIAAVLTPLSKALATEMANRVAYDAIQVHGGAGYMRDFDVERLYRDVRITNIYEGTTQLQYVAAIGGVMQRVLEPLMTEISHLPFEGKLRRLASAVDMAREQLSRAVEYVGGREDADYHDLMAGRLCEMQIFVYVSYLLLRDAKQTPERDILAERYVLDNLPLFEANCKYVCSGDLTLIDRHEELLAL